MQTQQLIVQALYSKFRAQRDEAQAGLAILINASVGVGDHITHVSEAENLIRKVAEAEPNSQIEVWGPGTQTRSFLYVDECVEATYRLMQSDFTGPVNIGSEEMISINDFARMAIDISGKDLELYNIDGDDFVAKYGHRCPVGVNGRNSDNALYQEKVGWSVSKPLHDGMQKTYAWISEQVEKKR